MGQILERLQAFGEFEVCLLICFCLAAAIRLHMVRDKFLLKCIEVNGLGVHCICEI